MDKRRSLTPPGIPAMGSPAHRRSSPRIETSARVTLIWHPSAADSAQPSQGWAINRSAGGVRVLVELSGFELAQRVDVQVGDEEPARSGQVVWLQQESDGMILGIAYDGATASELEAAGLPPSAPVGGT
jgi:hypothetical protein